MVKWTDHAKAQLRHIHDYIAQDSPIYAKRVADACFEFLQKLGVEYYCFHDRDVSPELGDLSASNDALDEVSDHLLKSSSGAPPASSPTLATIRVPPPPPAPTFSPTPPRR